MTADGQATTGAQGGIDGPPTATRRRRPSDRALAVQTRVVSALILREMRTRFGRTKAGYLWALFNPLAQMAMYSAIFFASGRFAPIGVSNELFVLTGIMPFMAFSNIATRVTQSTAANQVLFAFPGVTPLDAALARAILEVLTFLAIGLVFYMTLWLLDRATAPVAPGYIALSIILVSGLGFGFGLLGMTVMVVLPSWEKIVALLMFPLYFSAGVFFMPETMPEHIGKTLSFNPMMHVISTMRLGFYPDFPTTLLSIRYAAAFGLALTLLGLVFERGLRGRAVRP